MNLNLSFSWERLMKQWLRRRLQTVRAAWNQTVWRDLRAMRGAPLTEGHGVVLRRLFIFESRPTPFTVASVSPPLQPAGRVEYSRRCSPAGY